MQDICPKCKGTGKAPLAPELKEALAIVQTFQKGGTTAEGLRGRLPHVKLSAASMRLKRLFERGLIDRERRGKFQIYFQLQDTAKRK